MDTGTPWVKFEVKFKEGAQRICPTVPVASTMPNFDQEIATGCWGPGAARSIGWSSYTTACPGSWEMLTRRETTQK